MGLSIEWRVRAETNVHSAFHNVRMAPNPPVRRLKTYTGGQGYVYQY